jgi:hypothetical protein
MREEKRRWSEMTVTSTGPVDYMSTIVQKSGAVRGETLAQLLSALRQAERCVGEPLANIAEVRKVDITV